jgi:hypothetical protein
VGAGALLPRVVVNSTKVPPIVTKAAASSAVEDSSGRKLRNSFGTNVSGEAAHAGFREELRAGARHVAVRAAPPAVVAEPDERVGVGVVPLAAAVAPDAPVEVWAEPPAVVAEPDERVGVGVVPLAAAVVPDAPVEVWAEPPAVVAKPDERAEALAGSRRVRAAGQAACALAAAVPVGVTALRVAPLDDS